MSDKVATAIEQAVRDLDDVDAMRVVGFIESIKQRKRVMSADDVDRIVDSLVGSIPNDGMTLNDYRDERLSRLVEMA